MLGRKDYTRDELDHASDAIGQQLAAYKELADAVAAAPEDEKLTAALAAFEPLFVNNMILALDRYFVHRLRVVTGKAGNPLNEVEMLTDSLTSNNGGIARQQRDQIHPRSVGNEAGCRRLDQAKRLGLRAAVVRVPRELERKFV